MNPINRGLIQYIGIDDFYKSTKVDYFNQIIRDFNFCVPLEKPEIGTILRVWITPKIHLTKVVRTPKGESLEGQVLTGHKLMVSGELTYRIEYMATGQRQGLHTTHMAMPFCGSIALPSAFNPNSMVTASVFIEDITSEQLDARCIYNTVVMILVADLCE